MLFNPTKKQLLNLIHEYDTPDAPDDLIVSYKDFLKVRDFLTYYPFNPVVFENLLKLTIDLWTSKKRISRLSLLMGIYRYFRALSRTPPYNNSIPEELLSEKLSDKVNELIFNLFRMTVEDYHYVIENQVDTARNLTNSVLIGMTLSDENIQWLCDNAFICSHVLNRVLRYPQKSQIITDWAKNNFENDQLRERRWEIVGWILDYDSDFEILHSTILDDFRYLNDIDISTLKNNPIDENGCFSIITPYGGHTSTVNFSFKIYGAPYGKFRKRINRFDEVKSVLRFVYSDLENIRIKLKIWAIAQSRIEKETKVELLKKLYSEKTQLEIIRANKKIKSADLLRWILEKM